MANPFKSEYDALKDTGLTADQIKEALKKAKDLENETNNLKTELSTTKTTLTTMEGSFAEVKNRLNEIEANRKPPVKTEAKTYTSVIDDEEAAFNERFGDKAAPLAAATQMVGRNTAKMEARLSLQGKVINTPGGRISLSNLWDKWLPEIENYSQRTAPVELMYAATWINLFDFVKGKHIEELMTTPTNFTEPVQTGVDGKVKGEKEPEKLNDEEIKVAMRMGKEVGSRMTPEKYQEIKKKMTFVNV